MTKFAMNRLKHNDLNIANGPSILRSVFGYLSHRLKRHFLYALASIFLSSVAELATIASIVPFLYLISTGEGEKATPFVNSLFLMLSITDYNQMVLVCSSAFVFVSIIAAAARALALRKNLEYAGEVGQYLSIRAFRASLYQPYSFHLSKNSSELVNIITYQSSRTVNAIKALMSIISSVVIFVVFLLAGLKANAETTIAALVTVLCFYIFMAIYAKERLKENGRKITISSKNTMKILKEAYSQVKEILLKNTQEVEVSRFSIEEKNHRMLIASNEYIAALPRIGIETLIVTFILAFIAYLTIVSKNSLEDIIPIIGVSAVGSQRLLPYVQQIFNGWASFKASKDGVLDLLSILDLDKTSQINPPVSSQELKVHEIRFRNVSFSYFPGKEVLHEVNVVIQAGMVVGITGQTGSGKSTFVDLLLGLLTPSSGQVLIDSIDINSPENSNMLLLWRKSISYVPQNVRLRDDTVASNIAGLGSFFSKPDINKLIKVSKIAKAFDFIKDLPNGFDTHCGEDGISLSGGQAQRIKIAESLYSNGTTIVLDEATSALDIATERELTRSLRQLNNKPTIIMIAHRPDALEGCDMILNFHKGSLTSE